MRNIRTASEFRIGKILSGRLMQTRHSRVALTAICALLACFVGTVPSAAQQVTATITGQVTDPSGAAVAGAKVTATDTQRGTQYSAQTNSDGRYTISNILVGSYD